MITQFRKTFDQQREGVQGQRIVETELVLEGHGDVEELLDILGVAAFGTTRCRVEPGLKDIRVIGAENSNPLLQQVLVHFGSNQEITHEVVEVGDMAQ